MKERTKDAIAIGLLLIGAIADCESTRYFLSHGGTEANPIGAWALAKMGLTGLYLFKGIATVGILIVWKVIPLSRGHKRWGLITGGAVWLLVAAFNIIGTTLMR